MSPSSAAPAPADPPGFPGLLAHLGWVERLARALVRDAAAAEDLAQETLRVTLEQPRGRVAPGAMRSWLGGVVRRLALDRFRSEQSRLARERRVARHDVPGDSAGDPFEIVARSARQQRVAQAVHELAEPARATVLYRYLDELSTREVAARMGVTEELVRKRLERGLAELRRRLDSEFGADTKSWAIALLQLPMGAAAVTVKTKLALAAAVVIGAAVTWKVVLEPRRSAGETPAVAPSTTPLARADEPVESVAPVEAVRAATPARTEEVAAAPPLTAGRSVIPITVVDTEGKPCREGRIFGFWRASLGNDAPLRSFDCAIEGEVTRLELPPQVVNLLVAASVPKLAPSTRQGMTDHAAEDPDVAKRGHEWTTRTIVVGHPLAVPILSGRILVDGATRTPRGLAISCENGGIDAEFDVRIHAHESRYEIGPQPGRGSRLWVTSDETVPRQIELDGKERGLDLELAAERTLVLTVLDRRSDRPLAGVELHARMNVKLGKISLFRVLWRDHSHFVTTDAQGVARLTGVPADGSIEIRRDGSSSPTELKIDGTTFQTVRLREPLLELRLTPELGRLIERTIRIDAEDRRARVSGRVNEALLGADRGEPPLEIHWALVGDDGRPGMSDESLQPDAAGDFSFEVDRHHDYRVWAEREAIRFSEIAAIRVDDDDPPPLVLAPRKGSEVVLRFVRCPAEGFIHLYAPDEGGPAPRGSVFPATGGTMERRVPIDGPTRISVSWERQRGEKSGQIQEIEVDPASTPVVEVDLKGDLSRSVTVDLGDVAMPAQSILWLLPLGKGPDFSGRVSVQFQGREPSAPVVVSPGRHLAVLLGAPGLVAAVVDVPDGSRSAPLEIHLPVEKHDRAAIGAGVRLDRVGDLELDGMLQKALTLRLADHPELAGAESILLPAGAKFTLLSE